MATSPSLDLNRDSKMVTEFDALVSLWQSPMRTKFKAESTGGMVNGKSTYISDNARSHDLEAMPQGLQQQLFNLNRLPHSNDVVL